MGACSGNGLYDFSVVSFLNSLVGGFNDFSKPRHYPGMQYALAATGERCNTVKKLDDRNLATKHKHVYAVMLRREACLQNFRYAFLFNNTSVRFNHVYKLQ